MKAIIKIFSAKGLLALVPLIGLMVAVQNCDQGLAAAAFALSVLGVIQIPVVCG
jgi:hypothetical protein